MFKNISSIIKDSIGNITYRGNVVTGTVAVVRGDGSYDVFISESDRAYPKIFTLSRNPDLAVGDKVRILYKNGCKELPIILPPTIRVTPLIAVFVYQGGQYYINIYQTDGTYIRQFGVESTGEWYSGVICMDSNNNIFYLYDDWGTYKKYDIEGNLLLTKAIEDGWSYRLAIGSDNYVYSLEEDSDNQFKVRKRNNSDLTIVASHSLTTDKDYSAFTIDSNGNIFAMNSTTGQIEKWTFGGIMTASRAVSDSIKNGYCMAIVGTNVIGQQIFDDMFWTMPTSLAENASDWAVPNFDNAWSVGSVNGNYLLLSTPVGDEYIGMYSSAKTLVWELTLSNAIDITAYPF